MPKRVNLPGADELFRNKGEAKADTPAPAPRKAKHDEKITIYLSSAELVDIEKARLELISEYGIKVDRGRLVREATAMMLADFQDHGESSQLVQRLS